MSRMCRPILIVRCALLLIVTFAMESQGNSIRENKQNAAVQHKIPVNFITTWNQDKNSMWDDEDSVQHEFYPNYMKNFDEVRNQKAPAELRGNFTKSNDGNNFITSYEFRFGSNSNEEDFNKCNNTVCIPICCELGYRMIRDICTSDDGDYTFPEVGKIDKKINEVFPLVVSDPCHFGRYVLDPTVYPDDEYIILVNGSIYQPQWDQIIDPTTYCFAVVDNSSYSLIKCFGSESSIPEIPGISFSYIASLPFLLMTFVVYTVLPELWNMHGYALLGYVASLFVAQSFIVCINLTSRESISYEVCIGFAFVIYFSFMASFFWLNVMCFDIWWTFRDFQPLQRNVKQRDKKKFMLYSIYVLSCTALLTIICAIMDFVPSVPETFIKPEFGKLKCWFSSYEAKTLYFYGPLCVIIICNICLFICTASNIARQEKETAYQLRDLESSRHNDKKQRFKVYLKLFIMMVFRDGANWSIEVMSWQLYDPPLIVRYTSNYIIIWQGLMIFYMFAWNDKIKKLLLKRFGCNIFSSKS